VQYHEDAAPNVYNTYRMFVRLHGDAAPARLTQYLDRLERKGRECLARLAERRPDVGARLERLCEAGRAEFPRPAIPEPILDGIGLPRA
jgi:hypothetical protein